MAARHRLRSACARDRGVLYKRPRGSKRRRPNKDARHLLSEGLLDVVECGEARALLCLSQRRLVPGRQRRLGGSGPSPGRGAADGGTAVTIFPVGWAKGRRPVPTAVYQQTIIVGGHGRYAALAHPTAYHLIPSPA